MKKNIFFLLSLFLILTGCTNQATEIDNSTRVSKDGLSAEALFHEQLMETKYISDLKSISTPNSRDLNEGESIDSNLDINAIFDENSSLGGWVNFSSKKNLTYNGDSNNMINLDVKAMSNEENVYPFGAKGNINIVHQGENDYAKISDFSLDVSELDMDAKMYALLIDMISNQWINLENQEGGIISLPSDMNTPDILGFLTTMLETPDLDNSTASNFTFSVAEVLGAISNYINLGFSTEGLELISSEELAFSELNNGIIQKSFTGSFNSNDALFDFAFVASQKGIEMKIYNIVIGEGSNEYPEYYISIKEIRDSNYKIMFQSKIGEQVLSDIDLTVEIKDDLNLSGRYNLSSMEFIGQDISGTINGKYNRQLGSNIEMPDISGEVVTISELLGSL